MIAGLPMYDWPEIQPSTDAFWTRVAAGLERNGISAPPSLVRGCAPEALWSASDLLIGQTCGLPYVTGRCGEAALIGRPDYGLPGASGGHYASAIIMRRGDSERAPGASTAAINGIGSQSGCHALADWAVGDGSAKAGLFASVLMSGAHRASAEAVARGQADIAAMDAVTWALLSTHAPDVAAVLEVVAWTRPMPALPYITAAPNTRHTDTLRACLAAAGGERAVPGLPVDVLPATLADYAPVHAMALALRGVRLAPDLAPLAPDVAPEWPSTAD